MIEVWIEPSGENAALAEAEIGAAAEALGGVASTHRAAEPTPTLVAVNVPDLDAGRVLAGRLAFARRCLLGIGQGPEGLDRIRRAGAEGGSAAVRRLGRPSGGRTDPTIREAGAEFVRGGGRIDLERPDRRYWLSGSGGAAEYWEELAPVDRPAVERRRMPTLPFRRPVSLAPRLALAAANLARVRPGDRILDPFLGTGALLAEAGLLGARLLGIDRDSEMVRGALRNLAHLGLEADELRVGDAGEVEFDTARGPLDALLTDVPYGRSSGTGGEEAAEVVGRVAGRWADRIRPGGRAVLVTPGGYEPMPASWALRFQLPVRVHRSLTREFRVYERAG